MRFGWVHSAKEELLAATFGVRELPATFVILNGTTYQYRDFTFADKLANYLENEGFRNSSNVFPQTGRYFQAQLYLYTYPVKHIRQWYRANWEYWVNPRVHKYGLHKIKAT